MSVRLMRMAAGGGFYSDFAASKYAYATQTYYGFNGTGSPNLIPPGSGPGPISLPGGLSLLVLADAGAGDAPPTASRILISGFSADPGSGYLSTVICNNVSRSGSSATYSYGGGRASWTWWSLFGMSAGSNYNFRLFLG